MSENGTEPPLDAAGVAERRRAFAAQGPEEILRWALGRWRRRVAILTAFQAEGMVLLDMALRIDPEVRLITLDTGRLPEETYELIERVRERYGVRVEVFAPDAARVAAMVLRDGPNLFYRSVAARQTCCQIRKVEPLERALAGVSAWITGLRRDQSPSRAGIDRIEVDAEHGGLTKLNPLADWSWQQVWSYIEAHDVPCHALYAQGYTSIGCAPCTRPIADGEDPRAGRWWWESDASHKECGLHLPGAGVERGRGLLPVVSA